MKYYISKKISTDFDQAVLLVTESLKIQDLPYLPKK